MNFEVSIDREGFKGKAVIDFPTRSEKLAILQGLQSLGYDEEKGLESSASTKQKLELVGKMGEVVDKRLVSLDVTHVESGTQITDKAMLDIYSEGQILLGVIQHYILGGVPLGKAKS